MLDGLGDKMELVKRDFRRVTMQREKDERWASAMARAERALRVRVSANPRSSSAHAQAAVVAITETPDAMALLVGSAVERLRLAPEPSFVRTCEQVFAPAAEFVGLGAISRELADEALAVSYPEEYTRLSRFALEVEDGRARVVTVRRHGAAFARALDLQRWVYPLTPAGEVRRLPRGATALDFAYAIHSDLGRGFRAAHVDGRLVHATTALRSGETVVIVHRAGSTVAPGQLERVRTARARNGIRSQLLR
jgi:hypothetical protein